MLLANPVNDHETLGWSEVICGTMFSEKAEQLIRRLKKAEYATQKVETFKPSEDIRYDDDEVDADEGPSLVAAPAREAANIPIRADGCDVVGIDGAQFFDDEIVTVCNELANAGIRVIVAGLDMDFQGKPFGPMPALMATAEYVTKVHAVCTRTGNLAHYSYRKSANENLVLLGETDQYEPLSRAAYFKAMKEQRKK